MEQRSQEAEKAYDRLGNGYNFLTKLADKMVLNRAAKVLISQNALGSVLEVGVGTGKNLHHYPEGCDIVGIDISTNALQKAEAEAVRCGARFNAQVGDIASIPFDKGHFDTVVMTLVACQLDDPLTVFREMRRVCKPDGRVLFLEHFPPKTLGMKALFTATWPLARLAINCRPFSDNASLIGESGLKELEREHYASGALQTIVTQP
ncbi:MAG: class I SAM-dependent methyltransferase [Patescibacteria group bacterium]